MNLPWLVLTGTLALEMVLPGPGRAVAARQQGAQAPPPRVRVSVEVIPIDVQIVDREGQPIAGLGPDKFTVTINGRRHRVVSAEYIDSRTVTTSAGTPLENVLAAAATPGPADLARGRIIVVAIDCLSFRPSDMRPAIDAARDFIARLAPDVLVGLFAFPLGPEVEPTVDRATVIRALDSVVGQREADMLTQFRLRPAEIIDISTELPREDGPILNAVARRECGQPFDIGCLKRLSVEVTTIGLYYEAQANVSISGLRAMLRTVGAMPGRKTVVLVSGGLLASDRPGGRPDVTELGTEAGKEAARANTAIYTLHVDTTFLERFSAETAAVPHDLTNIGRDGEVKGRWLERFSAGAGGALFRVIAGSGEHAFERILKETSAHYLLGVEPLDVDRTGRPQEIKVKVDHRNATVRSRRWVALPKPVAAAASAPNARDARPPAAPGGTVSVPHVPVPLRSVAASVRPLAEAYERGDYVGLHVQLNESKDLANVIRAFRTSEGIWPENPRREAVFALELALAGLRDENGFAREQGLRLLAEYNARVRQPRGADAFECTWMWTEVAGLGGVFNPRMALPFVSRALARCPDEPRLHLAQAVITEQQWTAGAQPAETDAAEVMNRYEAAMRFPDTAFEARVRAAAFLSRTGKSDRALALLEGGPNTAADAQVRYLADLIRGRVLRALGRSDDAIAAIRSALNTWPGAQSARVALMSLLVNRGDREEAQALAAAVEASTDDEFDPWWNYWYGDYRAYPGIIAGLRELAR